ncbi:MAG: toxin-antitoxin system HicB family antitoxin [Acidobacteria bacterium]|nr:toxin-antitoxin system HicB family antitoxin [Acidobacteriota bacterium]
MALRQLTLRGFEPELERRLKLEARKAGVSLNQAALRLLRRGAGLGEAAASNAIGGALDDFIGTWSESDARSLLEATAVFDRVDEEFWR